MQITEERIKRLLAGDMVELQRILDEHKQETIEAVLRAIPTMIGRLVEYTSGIHNAIMEFYKENPEIEQHKDIVVNTIKDVEMEHAGKSVKELIEIAKPIIHGKIDALRSASGGHSTAQDLKDRLKDVAIGVSNGSI